MFTLKTTKTRRGLALVAGSAALALTLIGCSGGEEAKPAPERDLGTPVAGEIAEGALDGVTLTFAGSGGVFQDGQTEALWDPFAAASGATVNQDAFDAGKLKVKQPPTAAGSLPGVTKPPNPSGGDAK